MDQSERQKDGARLAFVHVDDVPWREVIAQKHGDTRVSVHEKFLEWTAQQMVVLGPYDPHVVVERHGTRAITSSMCSRVSCWWVTVPVRPARSSSSRSARASARSSPETPVPCCS